MALHTKKQFAKLCGITTKELSVYAGPKRRKVVYSGDYVDDTIQPNIDFLRTWLDKKKYEMNKPLPPLELPENLFWELAEGKHEPSKYNHAAEKLAVGIMQDAEKNNLPFPLIPICLTRTSIAQYFFDAYNFLLKREVGVLKNAGIKPTPEYITELISDYTALCRQSVENCIKDLENTVTEIVAEYEEKENIPDSV
jgi:hypothetical protein